MPAPPEAPNPDAAAAPTGPGTLRALVVDDGRDDAERAALICDDETLTHGALRARVAAVARALLAAGVRAGDRVAILLPNGAAFLEAFFGTTAIGAIAVPLNTRLHPTEHAALLQDCAPVVLVETAHALLMLEGPTRGEEAERLYQQAAALTPRDASERLWIELARAGLTL